MRIFLVGFMGSGKTTIGRKLANKLGLDFVDLDERIEQALGKSVSRIFEEDGEDTFRQHEADALRTIIADDNFVLSTGGGAPCFHSNMPWMNDHGVTIYLQLDEGMLFSRLLKTGQQRPLISGLSKDELREYIRKKLREREANYRMSRMTIDASNLKGPKLNELADRLKKDHWR